MKNKQNKHSLTYRLCASLVHSAYKQPNLVDFDKLDTTEPCMFVGNHAQLYGPIFAELIFPLEKRIWCIGEVMDKSTATAYCYKDFWPHKNKFFAPLYKIPALFAGWLVGKLSREVNAIPVYHDGRLLGTIKGTLSALEEGKNVVLFPEYLQPYNDILYQFYDKYVDVAKLYYKRTGKCLKFVPMYIAPTISTIAVGTPIAYDPTNDPNAERDKINNYIKEEITRVAKSLPKHKIVPYENIKKKNYPYNK